MLSQSILRRALPLILSLGLLAAVGCAVEKKGTDTNSGGDHKRDLAKKIPLNRTITDRVSAPGGDNTDWKYIDVTEEGKLQVTLSVDNPSVAGQLLILNDLGEQLERAFINAKDRTYQYEFEVEPGKKYYLQMQVSKFETVYSVGNQFTKKELPQAVIIEEQREEPKVVAAPRRPRKPTEKPVVEEEPPVEETKIVVTSAIISVIPWKEGKASRITFRQGTDQGIKRGATVAISSGGSCIVKDVFGGTSVCFVDKPTDEFKEGTKVVITSDK